MTEGRKVGRASKTKPAPHISSKSGSATVKRIKPENETGTTVFITLFHIRASNFGAEAERSYIFHAI